MEEKSKSESPTDPADLPKWTLQQILLQNVFSNGKEAGDPRVYPCFNCRSWQECQFAFDAYNIGCDFLNCLGAK